MIGHVEESLEEAQDIWIHLKVLGRHFEDLESTDYAELKIYIDSTMHIICLIWGHSKYYRNPAFIVTLFQEFSNYIVELVSFI